LTGRRAGVGAGSVTLAGEPLAGQFPAICTSPPRGGYCHCGKGLTGPRAERKKTMSESPELAAGEPAKGRKPAPTEADADAAVERVRAKRKSRAKPAPVENRTATPAELAAGRALPEPGEHVPHAALVFLTDAGLNRAECTTPGCRYRGTATADWFAANREALTHGR
jgi:hypothetical protein